MIEVGITAAPKVLICLCAVTIMPAEFAEMKVNFPQPRRMRRFVSVLCTPRKFLPRGLSLMEKARKLSIHDAGDPVHDENLPARHLLRLVEDGDRVFYIAVAIQQSHSGCIL